MIPHSVRNDKGVGLVPGYCSTLHPSCPVLTQKHSWGIFTLMPVTRTFLFTDIEGSTRSQQHNPVAWAANHARHDKIIEEKVRANNGELYKNTGDGFQSAFVNAPGALIAAIEIQRELGRTQWEA